MSGALPMWVGAQVGGRLILLICESCQRPLEDASVSGRVTYSYTACTEGRSDSSSGLKGGGVWLLWCSTGNIFYSEILKWTLTGKSIAIY